MIDCRLCPHHKARSEVPGFVECKAPMPTTSVIPAFYTFHEQGRVDTPFTVIRREDASADAGSWPLQYRPDSIAHCALWAQSHPSNQDGSEHGNVAKDYAVNTSSS